MWDAALPLRSQRPDPVPKRMEPASGMPGAGTLRLARNLGDPQRFLSVVAWESSDTVRTLKGAPEFRERMGRVQKHVDTFASAELEVLTAFNAGRQLRDA